MKKSYWTLFALAILSPFMVGVSFLMKYKEIAAYQYVAYAAIVVLAIFIILAIKELLDILKEMKK